MISHSNKKPCKSCENFQGYLEKYTGIKFTIVACQNLGDLQMGKDSRGNNTVSRYAFETAHNDSEIEDDYIQPASRLQVVIKSKSTTTTIAKTSSPMITTNGTLNSNAGLFQIEAVQKYKEIKKIKNVTKRSREGEVKEWCEDEYRPSLQKRHQSKKRSHEDKASPVSTQKKQKR